MTPVEDRIANLLYPLTDFYASEGRAAPRVEVLEGPDMPAPYRQLLVHQNDMTPTLERYAGHPIHLKVLQVRHASAALYRQVLLVVNDEEWPIEFGAIRINLPRFSELARTQIVEGFRPLGTILHQQRIVHHSCPTAFFSLEPDALIAEALRLAAPATLYGRHNIISDAHDQPLAEVVEILPPLPEKAPHDRFR
jgi:chorismate-pyruvate lyase